MWDTITTISAAYVVAGVVALVLQTTANAFAWYTILRFAYPGELQFRQMLAAYAACVALNAVVPANLGTIVMLVMLTTIMASATFAGLLGGFAVQKNFYTLAGAFVYLYLFLPVSGSFDAHYAWVKEHPWAVVTLLVAGAVTIYLVLRLFWPTVLRWWSRQRTVAKSSSNPVRTSARCSFVSSWPGSQASASLGSSWPRIRSLSRSTRS